MKLRSFFSVFILLCLFPSYLAAVNVSDINGDKFEETAGRGIIIRTKPAGVKVFIDGVERGLTPVSFENLLPGSHNISLFREGYKDRRFNVVLFNNSRLVVSIEMEEERGIAVVSVHKAEGSPESLPFNPQIIASLPDESMSMFSPAGGEHTMTLNLPAGYRTIRVRAFGWEDASITALISENFAANADIYMKPAEFKLMDGSQSRKRFNPKNSGSLGTNEYRFEISAPGTGTLTIMNKDGEVVYEKQLDNFDTWFQSVTWGGSDNMSADNVSSDNVSVKNMNNPVPEGFYTVLIEAAPLAEFSHEPPESALLKFETEVNYSIDIFPLSLSGGISGLVLAPLPHVLPAGSFQIEGGLLTGSFPQNGKAFSSLPFEIGVRISPVKRLEITSVFNFNPHFTKKDGWGVTGSLKFNILQGGNIPLAFAAGASYSWASENGENCLSPGRGAGFYAPLSLELANVSLVLSPGAFWHGPDSPIPALLLSAGLLYRGGWFNAGASLRPEFNFNDNASFTRLLAGVEARFFPPPSNLFFTVQAGVWRGDGTGGYGGVRIGVVY